MVPSGEGEARVVSLGEGETRVSLGDGEEVVSVGMSTVNVIGGKVAPAGSVTFPSVVFTSCLKLLPSAAPARKEKHLVLAIGTSNRNAS